MQMCSCVWSTFPFSGVGAWACASVYLCMGAACVCVRVLWRECISVSVWLCEGACVSPSVAVHVCACAHLCTCQNVYAFVGMGTCVCMSVYAHTVSGSLNAHLCTWT